MDWHNTTGLKAGDQNVVMYEARRQQLPSQGRPAALRPIEGRIHLRVLADRASIEVFGNDGEIALPMGLIPPDGTASLEVSYRGDSVMIKSLDVYEMCSAWR